MAKVGQALAVSFGALFGGALGFYFLEDYKIKSKEKRLALLLERRRQCEQEESTL